MPITNVYEQEKYLVVLGDYFRLLGFTESMILSMISSADYFHNRFFEGWMARIPVDVSFENAAMSLCFALGWANVYKDDTEQSASWTVPGYGVVKLSEIFIHGNSRTIIQIFNTR